LGIYGENEPLGVLIRRIVGLDRKAAKEVFSTYLDSGNLTAAQMTFINHIINHLSINGIIDPKALFSPPFTDMHDQGIAGILPQYAKEIVEIITKVNQNAYAA
jgi:type I restriction enzyme, R subunit